MAVLLHLFNLRVLYLLVVAAAGHLILPEQMAALVAAVVAPIVEPQAVEPEIHHQHRQAKEVMAAAVSALVAVMTLMQVAVVAHLPQAEMQLQVLVVVGGPEPHPVFLELPTHIAVEVAGMLDTLMLLPEMVAQAAQAVEAAGLAKQEEVVELVL